jgi:serine protease AprX
VASGAVAATGSGSVRVIVRFADGAPAGAAEAAVTRVGGQIRQRLGVISGIAADVPTRALPILRATAGITAVTPDAAVRMKGAGDNNNQNGSGTNAWRADSESYSLYGVARSIGAWSVWSSSDSTGKKITGSGVGVALIDSGVAPVKGLAGAGKVINGPDLSFESQRPNLRHLDTFGHGTHMAGIIAGQDPDATSTGYGGGQNNNQDATSTDSGPFAGVAPGAHIINLKVASADGATDVSQVIAAIDWVVQHRNDPGLNIRVLNLSFGTDSVQDAGLDPLSYAVEAAWRKGIVVVVAVGNDGPARTTLAMPAANPFVIAVGAADPKGTESRRNDDVVASFSTRGNAERHADLTAIGRSVVSLRNPGSFVDVHYPEGRIPGDTAQRFFRGSGTSQSAAVVSGAAALLLQQRPTMTPDQVKRLLMTSAEAMPAADAIDGGAGQLDVAKAARTATPKYQQTGGPATGLGSLELSRGSAHVADSETGEELVGERDIFGQPWDAPVWTAAAGQGAAWNGGTWNGVEWTGSDWNGSSWAARTWTARTWSARTWSGAEWTARTWSGAEWTAVGWSARTWSARTWSARTWSGDYWSASRWQ